MTEYSPRISRDFTPRYAEMDDDGVTTPVAMMGLFEETAVAHCDEAGWDVYRLRREGYGWMMLEGGFSMLRYPRHKELFTIETWMTGARLFYGHRGFEVQSSTGETIGKAWSLWVFYDLARGRPAPVLPEILESWRPDPAHRPARRAEPDPAGGQAAALERSALAAFDARALDIDTNGHVNNVRYLEWALEALPRDFRDGHRLVSVEGRFVNQVMLGQRVRPVAIGDGERYRLAVYACAGDGDQAADASLAACAASSWEPREPALD